MKILTIIKTLEQIAPLAAAAAWDKSGMQVAALRDKASHMALCLDPAPTAIAEALQAGAEFIVSHHPLCMKPRFTDQLNAYHAVLRQLFQRDVALYAAHTSLDANPDGPAGWYAQHLGLTNLHVLEPTAVLPDITGAERTYGFGVVGDAPINLSLEDLLAPIPAAGAPRLAGELPVKLTRIAICPGSGSSLAAAAAQANAQILVTGDLKYHDALEAPLPILDVGHFALEEEMMRRLTHQLQERLPSLRVTFIPARDPLRGCLLHHTSDGDNQ